ncbi:MAG: hypothetical protein IE928_08135 [Gammaproteobacteria bacterium]|nr:hypothetical protein [Gammaproteobacteria bacterium]
MKRAVLRFRVMGKRENQNTQNAQFKNAETENANFHKSKRWKEQKRECAISQSRQWRESQNQEWVIGEMEVNRNARNQKKQNIKMLTKEHFKNRKRKIKKGGLKNSAPPLLHKHPNGAY